MINRPRFLSLRLKLTLGFALLATLTVGATSYLAYQDTRAQLQRDIRERLRDAVAIAALQVDAEAHAALTQPEQEGSPDYLRLKTTLQRIRDAGADYRFVYTMRQDETGDILFIVDAEENEADVSHLGDVYDDASDWLQSNFAGMDKATVEDEMYTDKWGTWLTGYAPFYTPDGKRDGILGMDISAGNVVALERQARNRYLAIFFISLFPIALVGYLLGVILTAPIARLTEGASKLASGDLSYKVDIRTGDEIALLGEAFNATVEQLKSLVSGLEQRVEERTVALTRRTSQLQAAARVAREAAVIKDPATLLDDAARLISEQFGFYHAGIFLLDENSEYAVLHATSSEGGRRMLERGHRLKVGGQGIVGYAAAQRRPRIALDTGADATYFDNPDLPRTRSEAALPLVARERVIGVLDIQSDKPQAFSPEDIETFQALADQLALAIENARLFNEMESAVRQMEEASVGRVHETWKEIARARSTAYQYTPLGIQSVPKRSPAEAEDERLNIPIVLHNIQIGEISVKQKEDAGSWNPRERAMLAEIASQVGLALENARLLGDAQQRAARERAITEIAARISAAHGLDAILRVTAQEIGRAVSDAEVAVQIRPEALENE